MRVKAPADEVVIEVAGRELRVTSPSKVMFPERGETKLDLVDYYLAVEEPIMRAMGGRPVLMQRFPHGAAGSSFFQKRVPDNAPDWLETTIVSTPNGTTSRALVAADLAHIRWAVNLGCLGFHVWPTRADDPEHADELRIDLDPQPGVDFEAVRVAAREVNDAARRARHRRATRRRPATAASTCTSRLEPRWDADQVRAAAVAVARELARRRPDVLTDAWWKEERGERIFIDFNQNAPHKTVFGAWSARPRPGAQVSTPFTWDELDAIDADALTIATVPARVDARRRPVGRHRRRPAVARAAARDVRARPRRRASPTRRGRPCTRRCRASRRASRRAGPRRPAKKAAPKKKASES